MTTTPTASAAVDPYRLPDGVVPRRYDITLSPNLDVRDYVGEVAATVDVAAATDAVVLNANHIEMHEAWVVGADGARNDATWELDPETERLTLRLGRPVPAGSALVHLRFRGTLNDDLCGFYASTYTADDGTTKVIATTQMESTDARRAFPCWDEPALKAVFAITLIHSDGLTAVSNMPAASSALLASGKRMTRFADSPVMSSYLVAFVVGELEVSEPVVSRGVPIRVIARPGCGGQTAFALDVARFSIEYFEDWYGIAFPAPKLDLIATPDFAMGAMENLGAVTFRETLVLTDPTTATRAELERIADVVAHEIAHMWFGDLVTMKWWNGIWLNEAFATYAETACVAAYRPEWDRWTSFGVSRSAAAAVDGLHQTRPIEFRVDSPHDAEQMFDVLTYEKGCSVLRQLEQYLGEERFRDGVRHYLAKHAWGNAETTDLFDAIEEVTGEPVRTLMDSWIFQGGYPVVGADVAEHPDGSRTLRLIQTPFTYLAGEETDARRWVVPVLYRSFAADGTTAEHRHLLTETSTELALDPGVDAVLLNSGGHGFYRCTYGDVVQSALLGRFHDLAPIERYTIVADTWAAALQGTVPAQHFLDLVARVAASERDLNVWTAIISALTAYDRVLPEGHRAQLAALASDALEPVVADLGWTPADGESALRAQLRGVILAAYGTLANGASVVEGARERIDGVLDALDRDTPAEQRGGVDPDVVPAVLTVAARSGDRSLWERYRTLRNRTATANDSHRLLLSLGQFADPALVSASLDLTLSDEVKTQDAPILLAQLLQERHSGPRAWAFVRDHWDAIEARFPPNIVSHIVRGFATLSEADIVPQVRAFFAPGAGHDLPQAKKQIEQMLERLEVNARLRERVATA